MEINVRRSLLSVVLCLSLLVPALLLQGPQVSAAKKPRPVKCNKVDRPVIDPDVAPDGPTMKFRYCTGKVKSKDGTVRLDTSVTMPASGDGPFPLIVMLHGLTGSRLSNESDYVVGEGGRYLYNNLWFASKGYMVLSVTARGWRIFANGEPNDVTSHSQCVNRDAQSVDGDPDALYPGADPACYIQISHVKYDVADTQYLVGKLVDGTLTNAAGIKAERKIGVTGVSLGGGQTWLLTRKNQWKSPKGATVRVGAAAPLIGWTDIADALAPNGRRDETDTEVSLTEREDQPIGVKNDYVDVFFTGVKTFATDPFSTTDYLETWKDAFDDGEPYEGDPVIEDALHKLLTSRSAWFVNKTSNFDTPIFAVQGMTDGIFWGTQAVAMYNRLQAEREAAAKPPYPIRLYLGDWGHSPSQNKKAEFEYFVGLLNQWFSHYLKGNGDEPLQTIEARMTVCNGSDGALGDLYRGSEWSQLTGGEVYDDLDTGGSAPLDTPANDPHDQTLVPADGGRANPVPAGDEGFNGVKDASCRSTDTAVDSENFAWTSPPLVDPVNLLGMPEVEFDANASLNQMYVAARLWDVDPGPEPGAEDDTQTLVTRGVYRLGSAGVSLDERMKLFGNGYEFAPGHSIKLEMTADDSPSWQQWMGGAPGGVTVSNVSFSMPTARCENLLPECDQP
jgi:predicted acyl esterase